MSNFGFSKQQRLLSAADFKQVFDQASYKASSQAMLLLAKPNDHAGARIGFVIARKNVRFAVQRNRIKRLLREYFRLHAQELPAIDIVVMARKGIDRLDNKDISHNFARLCGQLRQQAQRQKSTANNSMKKLVP